MRSRGLLVWSSEDTPNGCYGMRLNVRGYTVNFFLDGKGENTHNFVLTMRMRCVDLCRIKANVKTLDELNIYCTNSIHANYVYFYDKENSGCDSYFINTLYVFIV